MTQPRLFPTVPARPRGRVTNGLEATVRAMRDLGRLEPVDAALVALVREAAAQLQAAVFDADESRYTRGVLIGRYESVLSHLLAVPDRDAGAELADLFAGMVDDAQPVPPD